MISTSAEGWVDGEIVVSVGEGLDRGTDGQPYLTRHDGVAVGPGCAPVLVFQQQAGGVVATGPDEGHHGVHVVEGVEVGAVLNIDVAWT